MSQEKNEKLEREKKMQKAMLDIKKKYGKKCNLKRNESAGGWNCDGTEPADRRT